MDAPTLPTATPIYFGNAGRILFGWYHPAADCSCAVVICAPLGNESTGWHRASRTWAEQLAAAGIAVLRFDYDGAGDSFGDVSDPGRVRAWVDSVSDAVATLRNMSGAERLVIAGVRLGATLALAAARQAKPVDGLILWVPFENGRAFLREGRAFTRLMGSAVSPQGSSEAGIEQFGGLALTRQTVRDLETFEPLEGEPRMELPVLLVPREEGASDAALLAQLAKAGARVERRALDGYASVITDAHEGEIPHDVIRGSIQWIRERVGRTLVNGSGSDADSDARVPPVPVVATDANGISERPLRIGDARLFGILTVPRSADRRRTGLLLVNSGAVYRVGPNRLHVTLARRWAALGYTVLRMDLGGLGDSPKPEHAAENRPYPAHAVPDVAAGIAALKAEGVEHVVVGGLCSGAHTTFHAALGLDGLDGIIMMNPIVFYWKPSDPLDVSAWRVYVEARHYQQSMRRLTSWRRLLTGRVDLLYICRIASQRATNVVRAKWAALRRRLGASAGETEDAARDFRGIASRGISVLLLFSEGDPGHDFLTLNYASEIGRLKRLPRFQVRVISDADHTFTTFDARQRVSAVLTEHLLAHHP